jgi:hypothetical protein
MKKELYLKLHAVRGIDDSDTLMQDTLDLWRFLRRLKKVGKQRLKRGRVYFTRREFDRIAVFLNRD